MGKEQPELHNQSLAEVEAWLQEKQNPIKLRTKVKSALENPYVSTSIRVAEVLGGTVLVGSTDLRIAGLGAIAFMHGVFYPLVHGVIHDIIKAKEQKSSGRMM